jgi:hypothetical protein
MEVVENLMHSDHFIVQFIVTCRRGKECVSISDEQIENVDHLLKNIFSINALRRSTIANLQGQLENVHLFGKRSLVGKQESKKSDQRLPQLRPLVRKSDPAPLLVAH